MKKFNFIIYIVGINLFGPAFRIDYYYNERFLHLVNFIGPLFILEQETIFSFNITNKSYLLIPWRISRPSFKFYYSFGRLYHFGWPQFNSNDNSIKWYHVVSWYVAWRQIDYGELREALTDIYYAVQYIHLILCFKYYERPGFQERLEIFDENAKFISKFISSPSEEIFALFPE